MTAGRDWQLNLIGLGDTVVKDNTNHPSFPYTTRSAVRRPSWGWPF